MTTGLIVRIDARRLTDVAGLHAELSQAFGFPDGYGNNLDALIDCLTYLDDPDAGMTRVHVARGQVATLVIEHNDVATKSATQVRALVDAVAFVNWRRIEKGEPSILAVAYQCG